MEAENPTSGLSFRLMSTLAFSAVTVVVICAGSPSSPVQPSSNASRVSFS